MPIINDGIAELPRSSGTNGNPPSKNNFVAEAIAQRWWETMADREAKATAIPEAGPYRASMAGSRCDRALWYQLLGIEESNPVGVADAWRMGLGSTIHEMLQSIAADMFGSVDGVANAQSEVKVDLRPIGLPGSAHLDMIIEYEGRKIAVEIKSMAGFGFKVAATTFKGPPQGPRYGHVLQGALAAKAAGCDGLIVAYLAMENVSPQLAAAYATSEAGRFAAEWHYTIDELEEHIQDEIDRMHRIIQATVEAPDQPITATVIDPEIPLGAEISNPRNGGWVVLDENNVVERTGSTWLCGYCRHQDRCIEDGRT